MNINSKIGNKIKKAREELDISQSDLGETVGYAVPTISQIESGKVRLSIESLNRFAQALHKPIIHFVSDVSLKRYEFTTKLHKVEEELSAIKTSLYKEVARSRKEHFNINVVGNVKIGKDDFIKKIGTLFNAKVFLGNTPDRNPYLDRFYKNKKKWAFHTQLYFLIQNFKHEIAIQKDTKPIISEWPLYENFRVVCTVLYEMKCMTEDEFALLELYYTYAKEIIRKPDLVIYLQSDYRWLWNHMTQVQQTNFGIEFVRRLNAKYDEWIQTFDVAPVKIIQMKKINISDESELKKIAQEIQSFL